LPNFNVLEQEPRIRPPLLREWAVGEPMEQTPGLPRIFSGVAMGGQKKERIPPNEWRIIFFFGGFG
jgi:hypothetical protein